MKSTFSSKISIINGKANRIWLDENNTNPLGEGLFAVEPISFSISALQICANL